eukprot:gene7409-2715_t
MCPSRVHEKHHDQSCKIIDNPRVSHFSYRHVTLSYRHPSGAISVIDMRLSVISQLSTSR